MTQDIIKKQSLEHIHIAGGVLVSRAGETLNYTLRNLLKWCDWILIVLDNEDIDTLRIVNEYYKKYPERIRVIHSGFKRIGAEMEGVPGALLQRFKGLQGPIRETVFTYMRKEHKKNPIDILIYPDSDEIFTIYFEKLLLDFWRMEDMRVIRMRCVWPFGDLNTIGRTKMCSHARVFKFDPKISTYPWSKDWLRNPTPFSGKQHLRNENILVHLSHFKESMLEWRAKNWRNYPSLSIPLWTLNKNVLESSDEDIKNKLKIAPDLTIGEYLKKHGKKFNN